MSYQLLIITELLVGAPKLTTEKFPNDMDTTSMALSVLPMSESLVTSVINDMLHFKSEDGVFMVRRNLDGNLLYRLLSLCRLISIQHDHVSMLRCV